MFIVFADSFAILWAGALQEGEIVLLEALEFANRRDDGRTYHGANDHVVNPLMGRFKHETAERNAMFLLVNETVKDLRLQKHNETGPEKILL